MNFTTSGLTSKNTINIIARSIIATPQIQSISQTLRAKMHLSKFNLESNNKSMTIGKKHEILKRKNIYLDISNLLLRCGTKKITRNGSYGEN